MNLKNKDITEGMRVSNGKYELRVVSWDKSYTDCLLNYLDSKGNRYVVAQNYELSGTEKDPQISWMNGRYFIDNSDDDAFETYLDYLGEVNEHDISESLKESKIADIAKSLKEVEKKLRKHFSPYDVNWASDEDGDFIVIANKKPFFYYVFDIDLDNMRVTMFEDEKALNSDYIKDVDDCYGAIIGLIEPYVCEEIEEKKNLKESKEFFVGDKTAKGFEVCMIEDGKKYYLSKLAKNIEDSSWSSDFTYAKHWKDKSRAEEVVDMLNSELKESKKSIKEEINRSTWGRWVVKNVHHIEYFFNGNFVNEKTLQSLFDSEGFDIDVATVENEIKKAVRSYRLENLDGTALHIAHNSVGNRIDLVFNVGGLIGYVESLSEAINECVIRINGDIYEQGEDMWNFGFAIYLTCDIYPMDLALAESKKKSRKSLKESAKPINEKNVAKFVDELNKWCDDNVHYKDVDSAKFTKQYGKLYDFGYNWDYSYGDKGNLLVFDKEGTLDWYEDNLVVPFIEKLAKKYGWYAEPCHSYSDFMFAEL